ncbi:MAG: excinuclease ABC subunit UvrA [bacterium]|nr:excinuclease ABC subunit UvrA [bacterium]
MKESIRIKGAREHNLKNISLEIPRNKMVVFTGVSGSGKSSLAFDTIFAEGQRRYIESLSAYARQFLGTLAKPDVDEIEGLSPAISIDQKRHSANPRSTVATITEIYDYLRVLFARAGVPHCPICGKRIQRMTLDEIVDIAIHIAGKTKTGKRLMILAPVVRGRKGEYYQMLYDFLGAGFGEVRIDGEFKSLREKIDLKRYKAHTIDLVVDKIPFGTNLKDKDNRTRVSEAVETALKYGNDVVTLITDEEINLSAKFTCPNDSFSFPEIEPRLFSFNSPYGACEACHGLGTKELWTEELCETCGGKRLRKEALSVLIDGKNIVQVTAKTIEEAKDFFENLESRKEEKTAEITKAPIREIANRLKFLLDVGLGYLTLDRKAGTLAGGEAQRIRLASQIGSGLTGTLYVLDEPTIGLHQKDNAKLIRTLLELKNLGNTIIVVEHDEETIRASDYLVDIGPGAGVHGGYIVAEGKIPEILKDQKTESLTLDYLRGKKRIEIPGERRGVRPKQGDYIKIHGATENNLKNIDVDIPLKRFVAVTGVSGSGKSTLVYDVLYKSIANKLNGANYKPGRAKSILGLPYIHRVINIDQSPIGRTPRSNPATYVGVWTPVRELFAGTEDARVRGYKMSRFSFNVRGGRCENCEGHGTIAIEMHFLPTVFVTCDTCKGKRFQRETLEIKYRGKNVHDVLQMTIEEATKFFSDIPWIREKLVVLNEVGLGYLELGQPAPTLSGGEAQRVKLAAELGKRDTRRTLYLLDEPTTGLHFDDIKKLLDVLQRLVDKGNTVVVIEHNLDVIKSADWIIDLGPEGGERGGHVVAEGTPEDVSKRAGSFTGEYLQKILKK